MTAVLSRFLDACKLRRGATVEDSLRDATGDLLRHIREDPTALEAAATAITDLSEVAPSGASWLAVTLGTAAERDGSAAVTGPLVLEQFRTWLERLPQAASEDGETRMPHPTEAQAVLLEVFPELCQSVVAHVARLPDARLALVTWRITDLVRSGCWRR